MKRQNGTTRIPSGRRLSCGSSIALFSDGITRLPYIAAEVILGLVHRDHPETSIVGLVLTAGTAILSPGSGSPTAEQAYDSDPESLRSRIERRRAVLNPRDSTGGLISQVSLGD